MVLAKARHLSLSGAGVATGLGARPKDPFRVIPASEFVSMVRRCLSIEGYVAPMSTCCNAVGINTPRARICPRVGAQVNQHQQLLHAISRALTRLGVPRQVKSEE